MKIFGMEWNQLRKHCVDFALYPITGTERLLISTPLMAEALNTRELYGLRKRIIDNLTPPAEEAGEPMNKTRFHKGLESLLGLLKADKPPSRGSDLFFLKALRSTHNQRTASWLSVPSGQGTYLFVITECYVAYGHNFTGAYVFQPTGTPDECSVILCGEADLLLAFLDIWIHGATKTQRDSAVNYFCSWCTGRLNELTAKTTERFERAVAVGHNGSVWCADRVAIVHNEKVFLLPAADFKDNKIVANINRLGHLFHNTVQVNHPDQESALRYSLQEAILAAFNSERRGLFDQAVVEVTYHDPNSLNQIFFATVPEWVPPELLVSVGLPPELSKVPALRDAPPSE